jgi:hypothetical protein
VGRRCGNCNAVIPSAVENGAAREAATWTGRPEAERTGSERIKSRCFRLRSFSGVPRLGCAPLGMTELLPGSETTVDVTFQMGNGGLLAGNHMFHQVADRDHSDHLVTINHRQVTNVLVRH